VLKADGTGGKLSEKKGKAQRSGDGGGPSEEAAQEPADGAEVRLAMTWGGQPGDQPALQPALGSRTLWNGAGSAATGVPELRIWDQPEEAPDSQG
jgi:hypothetical protein